MNFNCESSPKRTWNVCVSWHASEKFYFEVCIKFMSLRKYSRKLAILLLVTMLHSVFCLPQCSWRDAFFISSFSIFICINSSQRQLATDHWKCVFWRRQCLECKHRENSSKYFYAKQSEITSRHSKVSHSRAHTHTRTSTRLSVFCFFHIHFKTLNYSMIEYSFRAILHITIILVTM